MGKDYWKIADGDYNCDGSVDFDDELEYDKDFFNIDADPIAMEEYENYLDDCEAEERRRGGKQEDLEDREDREENCWDEQKENQWGQEKEDDWYERERREGAWRDDYVDEAEEYGLNVEDYDDEDDFLEVLETAKEEEDNFDDDGEDGDEEDSFDESAQTKPTEGVWKYYESFCGGWWKFKQALIENFPELAEDYEADSGNATLCDVIRETYEIDKERTVTYLRWLWKTFTPDLFADEEEDGDDRESFKVRGELLGELILENEGDEYLYKLLITEEFIAAAFKDCVHTKHEYYFTENYMEKMIRHKDVEAAKRVYSAYLEGQKGRYTNKDLGNMWDDIVNNIDWMDELVSLEKLRIAKEFIPFINAIGERGKKPLQSLAKYQKEWKEMVAVEKEMAEEEAERAKEREEQQKQEAKKPKTVEKKVDNYAWRRAIAPSRARFVNPNEYETKEEYEQGYKRALLRAEEEQSKVRRAGYTKDKICKFCKVDVPLMTKSILYYFTGDLELNVGDEVVVPFGGDNREYVGTVVSVGQCYASIFPFDIKQMKTVIRKAE